LDTDESGGCSETRQSLRDGLRGQVGEVSRSPEALAAALNAVADALSCALVCTTFAVS
jgi:hypothetical protein